MGLRPLSGSSSVRKILPRPEIGCPPIGYSEKQSAERTCSMNNSCPSPNPRDPATDSQQPSKLGKPVANLLDLPPGYRSHNETWLALAFLKVGPSAGRLQVRDVILVLSPLIEIKANRPSTYGLPLGQNEGEKHYWCRPYMFLTG